MLVKLKKKIEWLIRPIVLVYVILVHNGHSSRTCKNTYLKLIIIIKVGIISNMNVKNNFNNFDKLNMQLIKRNHIIYITH